MERTTMLDHCSDNLEASKVCSAQWLAHLQSISLEHLCRGSLKRELLVLAYSIFSGSEGILDLCREQMRTQVHRDRGSVCKTAYHRSKHFVSSMCTQVKCVCNM